MVKKSSRDSKYGSNTFFFILVSMVNGLARPLNFYTSPREMRDELKPLLTIAMEENTSAVTNRIISSAF